jgi:TRAP transporter TAXI family solute receptor
MKGVACLVAMSVLFVFAVSSPAQTVTSPAHLRMGTADLGSAHYVYGAVFAKLWRNVLPKGSTIDVLPYAGGTGNALLMDKGDADLGLLFGAAVKWAHEGTVVFNKKHEFIRGLVGALDKYYIGIMATKKSGITSLEEVVRKKMPVRVVSQPQGGASEASMRLVLQAYGMPYETIRSWGGSVTPTSTSVAQNQMADGKADIWINMLVANHPMISELAVSTDIVFLPISDEIVKKLEALGFKKDVLPAKSFRGQDKDVQLVGWPTTLVGHKDLSTEVVYVMTKTLLENKPELVKGHAALKDFVVEDAWKFQALYGAPLHPGAEKYYREKGMMK